MALHKFASAPLNTHPAGRIILLAWLGMAAGVLVNQSPAQAQVRGKLPDRGVYESPRLQSVAVEDLRSEDLNLDRVNANDRSIDDLESAHDSGLLRPVSHNDVILTDPQSHVARSERFVNEPSVIYEDNYNDMNSYGVDEFVPGDSIHAGGSCDGCGTCDGECDGGCGLGGCDSGGCDRCCGQWSNGKLSFCRDQWFGGVDLMLMFRDGDHLPPLVTTGPSTSAATAGRLGQAGTRILAGGDTEYKDPSAGFRLTLGTWLDESQCRSLVFRGWVVTEESFSFNSNQDRNAVLARPFFDVSQTPNAQSTVLIAFPNAASGSIDVRGTSNVFGGDISVRQLLYGRFGGSVDVLYGYQYMRLDEDLSVSSTSLSLDGSLGPAGSVISIADSIDTENEFHGGQLGIASRYREGCWSFRSLAKIGLGSLRRTAKRSGSTVTENGTDTFTDPNGLLVRSTNDGNETDYTLGWVPELDLSLGWHRFPHFDVTLGYQIVAMTDALEVSGAIDRNLASNLSTPLTGAARPSSSLRYDTFYVQGIHLGLQYAY